MKMKKRLCAGLLALLAVCAVPAAGYAREDATFVTESLTNYRLGYMSWGVKRMGLDTLQEKLERSGRTLPEVRVAVIDSGISTSNKYLRGRYTADGYNFINNSADVEDEQYHGTMVSGIIADGTSSNVKVLPIKVNDKSGKGSMQNVAKGIYYAIEHGADVINLSISSEDPQHKLTILDDAIDAALAHRIVVVVAAGNQSGDTADRYPARKDNVITVTSVDKNDRIAENANTGSSVDFALPGVLVFAPYKSAMFVDSGTSLAAPHAAAAAALLKTWNKSLDQDGVTAILKQYAVDLGDKGFDDTYGWGMIDLSGFDINAQPATEPVTEAPTTEPPTEIPTTEQPTTEQPTTEQPTAPPVLVGDADGDGLITINDVTAIQRWIAGVAVPGFREAAADADGNGVITIVDGTAIQRFLAGMIPSLPAAERTGGR